jgi:hypothetical protein
MSELIFAVNRSRRVAITHDGHECALTNLFDADGEETDDADIAFAAVCQLPDGLWATIDLTQFDPVSVH